MEEAGTGDPPGDSPSSTEVGSSSVRSRFEVKNWQLQAMG